MCADSTLETQAQTAVQHALDWLDNDLARAAVELADIGLDGHGARTVMQRLLEHHRGVAEFLTIGAEGTILVVEPTPFRAAEGREINARDHLQLVRQTRWPLLSACFAAVEGYTAVELMHPVVEGEGDEFIGAVTGLIDTQTFLGTILKPLATEPDVDSLWAMDTSGVILYDPDAEEALVNLLTDSVYQPYTRLVDLGRDIIAQPAGAGAYVFPGTSMTEPIEKQASWVSVGLHGTAWRLVVARRE